MLGRFVGQICCWQISTFAVLQFLLICILIWQIVIEKPTSKTSEFNVTDAFAQGLGHGSDVPTVCSRARTWLRRAYCLLKGSDVPTVCSRARTWLGRAYCLLKGSDVSQTCLLFAQGLRRGSDMPTVCSRARTCLRHAYCLLNGSDVPIEVGLGRIPFLPPSTTHTGTSGRWTQAHWVQVHRFATSTWSSNENGVTFTNKNSSWHQIL